MLKAKKGSFLAKNLCREQPVGARLLGLAGSSPRSLLPETSVGKCG